MKTITVTLPLEAAICIAALIDKTQADACGPVSEFCHMGLRRLREALRSQPSDNDLTAALGAVRQREAKA